MSKQSGHFYEFGPFRLDAEERRLTCDGRTVPLTPKALEILLVLVRADGRLVGKEELIGAVWPDTFIEEGNLSVHISALRKALSENGGGRGYIETLPRRGYRFSAELLEGSQETFVLERHSTERVVVEEIEAESEPSAADTGASGDRLLLPATRTRPRSRFLAAAALLVLLSGALAYVWTFRKEKNRAPSTALKSIAVLPLRPIGPEGQAENFLGVGLADALITQLGSLNGISVRPTSAVLRFDSPQQDALAAARVLGVDAVLEGSYQRAGERIRVTVQLVGARDGAQLWSGTFEDEFVNIFTVQDSISRQVTQALVSNLDEAEQRSLARRPTENVEAYQLYLKGRYFWSRRTSLSKALQYFEQAVQIDPRYARAYSGLADCYLALSEYGILPRAEAYSKALAAAQRALSLDPAQAEAHTTLGFIYLTRNWDYPNAEREFKTAIELDPNDATAHQFYGVYLLAVGQKDAAIAETRRALELDSLSILNNSQLGRALYLAGRYDDAIEQCRKSLELDPASARSLVYLGQSYAHKGMLREAIAELEKALKLSDGHVETKAALAYAYALSGRKDEARKIIDELSALDNNLSYASYHIATIYAGFPEKEQAFVWLQKAYEERDIFFGIRLKVDPKLDILRPDPRFQELLRRIGLST